MNYEQTLVAAQSKRITLQFASDTAASSWRFRCYSWMRRNRRFQSTIIAKKGSELEVFVPDEPFVKESE